MLDTIEDLSRDHLNGTKEPSHVVLITSAVKDVLGWSVRTCSVLRKVKPKVMFKGNQTAGRMEEQSNDSKRKRIELVAKETRKQLVVEKNHKRLDRLA